LLLVLLRLLLLGVFGMWYMEDVQRGLV